VTVSKEIQRLENSAVKLTVTIGKDDVRAEYDSLVANYRKTIQIPGFRKGKVPQEVLVRKFAEAFKGETLGNVIEKSITEIFEDESFPKEDRPLPYSTPQVQDEPPALDLDQALTFSVVYDVLPQITVGAWKGLTIEAPNVEITDEDLNRELDAIRERNAVVLDRDDDAAALKGDVVTVDYVELSEAGEPLEETGRKDFAFTLGSEYNTYRFDDEVAGMKKGETRDLEKTYAADLDNPDLAGKAKKIRVTLTALKEKKLPDLDDDLAQDVDEKYQTLEDLKTSIRERLTKNLDRRLREIKISRLLEKILENTPIAVPESMVRIELESRWRNMARQFNMDPEELTRNMEKSGNARDSILEGWRPEAQKALQSRIIVETLVRDQGLAAPDEEVEKEFETLALETDTSIEDVKKYYETEQMREYLKDDIKERKFFDLLLAENTIKKGSREKYLDLISKNG
jgi:trigger factor